MTKIKNVLALKIDEETWMKFKLTIPRDTSLNEAVCQLVEKHVLNNQRQVSKSVGLP